MRADIVPGGTFPDYELTDHTKTRRRLSEVTREIRPDWDLAAPGPRGNWEAGDHSMHHPYQAGHNRSPSAADTPSAADAPSVAAGPGGA